MVCYPTWSASWPPEVAEWKALLFAARLAHNHHHSRVIFETVCQNLVSRLSRGAIYFSDLDSILEDVLFISRNFVSVDWLHVCRDGNCVARHLARVIPFGVEQRWKCHVPSQVAPYVLMDVLSLS